MTVEVQGPLGLQGDNSSRKIPAGINLKDEGVSEGSVDGK